MKFNGEKEKYVYNTRNSRSAVDKHKNHATVGPSNAKMANTTTLASIIRLLVINNGGHSEKKEEKGGNKLCNCGSVE
jgi:hypothetical protein